MSKYVANFIFTKEAKNSDEIINEFVWKRGKLVELLNPNYEKWNAEFGDNEVKDDDPLAEFGGTEYLKFINSKQRVLADAINGVYPSEVSLMIDEIGDIYGVMKDGNEIHLTLS